MGKLSAGLVGSLLFLGVAGCGGSTGHSAAHSAVGGTVAFGMLKEIGCTPYTMATNPELFAANEYDCTSSSTVTDVLGFASSTAEAHWIAVAHSVAGSTGTDVVGNGWVVEANNGQAARSIQAQVGGTVQ